MRVIRILAKLQVLLCWPLGLATWKGEGHFEISISIVNHPGRVSALSPALQPTHHLGALLRLLLVERLILLVHRLPDHRNDK